MSVFVIILEFLKVLPLIIQAARLTAKEPEVKREVTNAVDMAFKFKNPEILRARLRGDVTLMHQLISEERAKLSEAKKLKL